MIRQFAAVLIVALTFGSASATAQSEEGNVMGDDQIREVVTKTLADLQAAIQAQDIEKILASYSNETGDNDGIDEASRRTYYNGLFALGIFKDAKFDMSDMEVAIEGVIATAAPVIYVTTAGTASYEYKLRQAENASWLIVASSQIPPPMATNLSEGSDTSVSVQSMQMNAGRSLLADAGLLVENHAMLWVRRLDAPIEEVWDTVSTLEGLQKWWVVPPRKFELQKGGAFNHHWNNTVQDFKQYEFIDFAENTGNYASTGGMRFELGKIDDHTTMFMFLDTWGPDMNGGAGFGSEQPGGPGTPWPGVAAGWHVMVDKLEYALDGKNAAHTMDELTVFYTGYLRDYYRWNAMVQRGVDL